MNQPASRNALAPPWLHVAITITLLAMVLIAPRGEAAPAAVALTPRYCYNWDFLNNTGQDADDLHMSLRGVTEVSDVYTGPANPFGPPGPGSGYDAGLGVYNLHFSGGPVFDGDFAHIGICTGTPFLRLGEGVSFYWTSGGLPLAPVPLFIGVSWDLLNPRQARISLYNDQDQPLVIWSLNLLAADVPLGLDDLNAEVFATAAMVGEFAQDVVVLAPKVVQTFDVQLANTAIRPLLLEVVISTEDDPGNTAHLYSQVDGPRAIFLPIILKS